METRGEDHADRSGHIVLRDPRNHERCLGTARRDPPRGWSTGLRNSTACGHSRNGSRTEGAHGCTPTAGIPELRSALAKKITQRDGFDVKPDQVVLGNGGVQGIYATLVSLTRPGDVILLPDPAWPNFNMMAALLGLLVVHYSLTATGGYVPDIDELQHLVDARNSVLLSNSPSNPLGSVVAPERMVALVAFAVEHDLWVLSDECYDEITFDGPAVSPATFDTDGRVISVYSFSKTYAMTGWRLRYVAAPSAVAGVLAKAQEPLLSCLNTPTQYAALTALESTPMSWRRWWRRTSNALTS
ncbi:MAG: pyridoxal phosphate-dependent aminotransferase [Geodermatophilaceae bacterium]